MAQKSTTKPARKAKGLKDLTLKADKVSSVRGGSKPRPILMQACATGVHFKEATITH